jgi:NOL1/NOP2/fmu family ribosome biogenesis protein
MEERFGIPPRVFDPYLFLKRKKAWYLLRRSLHLERAAYIRISRAGLKAFQQVGAYIKPSTRLIQVFGHRATKSRVQLDMSQLQMLWEGKRISADQKLENGYVILTLKEKQVLGVGLLLDGKINSQLPHKQIRRAMFARMPGYRDA